MNKIENELTQLVETQKTPSVQYAWFDKDEVRQRYSYGLANVKDQVVADMRTTYHGFSTTKTFTAVAVLQLVEAGKVDINAPAQKYLPDFPYQGEITVKHLLNHTAGIPNPVPLSWIHLESERGAFNRNDFFKPIMAKHHAVKAKPNEKFAYTNLGYILLGQLIEQVSGMSYEHYIEEHILRRIGLGPEQLGFTIYDHARNATGYHKKSSFSSLILGLFLDKSKYMGEPEGSWKSFRDYYVNGAPYGGLIGTADAYVRYVQELLKPDSALLSPEYKRLLFVENHTANGKPTGMCLSWYTGVLDGHRYYTHAGGGGGYYCEIRIYPERGVGSVVMFNRTGMTDERYLDKPDRFVIGDQ